MAPAPPKSLRIPRISEVEVESDESAEELVEDDEEGEVGHEDEGNDLYRR